MLVATQIPSDLLPAARAHFLSKMLGGMAEGVAPLLLIYPLPPIYSSGVVFRYEPGHGSGEEDFALPWTAYARGWVDCDDAAIWRAGELIASGVPATIRADYDEAELHVYVRISPTRLEDPARILIDQERNPPP